ncbi:M12 family metallopeptidase [Roseivirga sp. BDSF3-8]|uniref:M12 family metallopeptidase n=1 Tax=Roseivirga sp. BDSF3-8 TaxID=3241598 RepID=UPI0035321B07
MRKLNLFVILFTLIGFSCQQDQESLTPTPEEPGKATKPEQAFAGVKGEIEQIETGDGSTLMLKNVDGTYILGGDMILTQEQVDRLRTRQADGARTGLADLAARWPDCEVFYTINSSLPNQSRVTDAIAHWEAEHPWLKFTQRTTEADYIEFIPVATDGGCFSQVGMIGGRQTIGLESACSTGNTIHEIGHALGLFHEQMRADRGNWVTVNWANIRPGFEINFQTYDALNMNGFEIGSFDFNSIMLYGSYDFSVNGLPTLTRLDGSVFSAQRTALSAGDLEVTELMYDCEPMSATISGPAKGDNSGTYTWSASVRKGTAPFTYLWKYSYDGISYNTTWSTSASNTTNLPLDRDLYLKLTVTDANGEVATTYHMTLNMDAGGGIKP